MQEQTNMADVEISLSVIDIEAIIAAISEDQDLRESLSNASIIIVPTDLGSDYEGPAFPLSTREIFRELSVGLADRGTVEATISDDDYRAFDFRSDLLLLPVLFIADNVLLPLGISILGAFIFEKFKNRNRASGTPSVKAEIHFKDSTGRQLSYKYDGPSSTFEEVTERQLRELGVWLEEGNPLGHDKSNY